MKSNTIAAIATPMTNSGIGIIRISGDEALDIIEKVFKPKKKDKKIKDVKTYTAHYGHVYDESTLLDECIVLVMKGPHSYTAEDVVEINCHGGVVVMKKVLEAVFKAGATPAEPGEFTKRAFLNGKMDLTQAESVAQLISSNGETAAKASYNLLQGSLSRQIDAVLGNLEDTGALMAAWVDYPDEEIPELGESELEQSLKAAKASLEKLLAGYENGQIITQGVDTAIVGKPNAGKSTLMNLLAGREKSIVTDIAGTTRDIVEESVRLGNITLRLSDTAGIRESDDTVEAIGIRRALEKIDSAELVIAVFDNSMPLDENDLKLIERCKGKKAVAAVNKIDLNSGRLGSVEEAFAKTVYISAKGDEYLNEIAKAVEDVLGVSDFDAAAPMLANRRQKQCCKNALQSVNEALDALQAGMTYDAINVLIDCAVDELLELTGKKATTEVVNNIFSKFCVGK